MRLRTESMRRRQALFFPATFALLACPLHAALGQSGAGPVRGFAITRVDRAPVIDGRLDDAVWTTIRPIAEFWKMRPVDDQPAAERTETYLAYDADNLYVAIHAYEPHPNGVRASLANRDQIFSDDVVGLFLDTFHDGRRGYLIFANPLGIQADAVTVQGQDDDWSIDLVWQSKGRRTADGYVVEMAIPFRSLRFRNAAAQTWGFAVIRFTQHSSEQDIFPRVDVDNNCLLCQAATLSGLRGISPGRTLEVLPTLTGLERGSRADPAVPFDNGPAVLDAGVGVKYGITPNLTADGALNPDFSQVETDAGQVEVNQRFALFFPEKRPFFLEGQEIFQTPIQLVYTRTIFEPLVALKLTGKVGGTTVGALSAVDDTPLLPRGDQLPAGDSLVPPPGRAAFTVVRMRQDVGRSTVLGLLATDREFAGSFNRVAGADGQVQFLNLYSFRFQGVWSETRNLDGERLSDPAFRAALSRTAEHVSFDIVYNDIGPDFRANAGFIRRTDLREGRLFLAYQQRPNGALVLRWGPQLFYRQLYDHSGIKQDQELSPGVSFQLARNTYLNGGYTRSLERFADSDFFKRRYFIAANTEPWKLWGGGGYVEQGDQIHYDPDSAYLGYSRDLAVFSTLRPSDGLKLELNLTKSTFWRARGGAQVFDVNIVRGKATYQFSKEFFLRAIGEWNSYGRTLDLNALLSYTASPGTVFFLGVDDRLEGQAAQVIRQTRRTVFFKASYLWRL